MFVRYYWTLKPFMKMQDVFIPAEIQFGNGLF